MKSDDDGWSYFDFDSNPFYWQGDKSQHPVARNGIRFLSVAIDNIINKRDPEGSVDLLYRARRMMYDLGEEALDNRRLRRNTSEYLEPPADDE